MKKVQFARMPSARILSQEEKLLTKFRWEGPDKSANIAALMLLIVFMHEVKETTSADGNIIGIVKLTYDDICKLTSLSRASISKAIKILLELNVIQFYSGEKTKTYSITGYSETPWAKLPVKSMYEGSDHIKIFAECNLRLRTELDALKLFLLFVAFRNSKTNYTQIGYDKIMFYTDISRNKIKSGISFLTANSLLQVSQSFSSGGIHNETNNRYRVLGIEHLHEGNTNSDLF